MVVTDVRMPPGFQDEGLRTALELVLVLSQNVETRYATELTVAEASVAKHIRNILQKLGLPQTEETHRRVLAVLTFLRSGPKG